MSSGSQTESGTRTSGIFKDYFLALDKLRSDLQNKEDELRNILTSFYKSSVGNSSTDTYRKYLQSVSASLDACNDAITTSGTTRPITIDGLVPIAKLINLMKHTSLKLNETTLGIIIDFWENITYTFELLQILLDSLENNVYAKLSVTGSGSQVADAVEGIDTSDEQVKGFVTDIERFSKSLPNKILNCRLLIRSCGTHMRMALIDRSTVADALLFNVAVSNYPLLRVVPDLEHKLTDMFRVCRKWLDREEKFILNINQEIRQRRLLVKEKEMRIISARVHQKDVLGSLKTSSILCQNSKVKLREIVKELKFLEAQIHATCSYQQQISEEKQKSQSMAEFLSISISQTRRNYNLQMKKQRLEIQVGELETTLIQLDSEISSLKQEMVRKSQERNKTKDQFQTVEKTYLDAKADLESYSKSLLKYQNELVTVKESLKTMEGLQLLKSSPEYIDNVFGPEESSQNQSVHLAPSLQNAINKRTQKMNHSM